MTDVLKINYSNIFGGEKATRPNRMLRAAQKQESLALPDNYREIPEEEMYYEGGGGALFVDGMPSWMISVPLDLAFMACGLGLIWAPLKMLGKKLGGKLVSEFLVKNTHSILSFVNPIIKTLGGAFVNISVGAAMNAITQHWWNFTSLGGIVGFAADIATDGRADGWISW